MKKPTQVHRFKVMGGDGKHHTVRAATRLAAIGRAHELFRRGSPPEVSPTALAAAMNLGAANGVARPPLHIGLNVHDLKSWPEYFRSVSSGSKRFEIRRADRAFADGDYLMLREFDPRLKEYTGERLVVKVRHVFRDFDGIAAEYVLMSIDRAGYDVADVVLAGVPQNDMSERNGVGSV